MSPPAAPLGSQGTAGQPPSSGHEAPVTPSAVAERLDRVREQISTMGVDPATIRVVAVTKGFGSDALEAAVAAGLVEFGENYAQELLSKVEVAPAGSRWHFLGAIQANKVRLLASHVDMWESLDSIGGIEVLARRCPGAHVLVQVNLQPGAARRGAPVGEVPALVRSAAGAGLDVRGLMAVGAVAVPQYEVREGFARVSALAGRLGLAEVSMGMSEDFQIAVAEGATIIRLGRALFGERPVRARG